MEKSPSRWWDLPSAGLFMLIILISVWRLTITNWTENLGYVINLAVVAAILGLALGASRFGKRAVFWLALGYTLVFFPNQLIAFYDSDIYLGERLASVGGRLLSSIGLFLADKPVKDPMFSITLLGILYWCVAMISGYQLVRYNRTLVAILPAGLVILVIHQFDHGNTGRVWLIALFLFAALILLARGKYLRDRMQWQERGIQLSPETGPDLGVGALISAALLILLAWNLPLNLAGTPALEEKWLKVTRPWRETRDRLGRAFDALEGQGAVERGENFRSSLGLGSRAATGDATIFKISVPPEAMELPRLYWRARVYDHYENGAWTESPAVTGEFTPTEESLSIPDLDHRKEYEFTITSFTEGQAVLSLPAQPLWLSRPVDVTSFPLADGTRDILYLQSFPFLEPGETFRVRAAMANPTILELRAAGRDYPEWVKRYLQLPDNFSQKVRNFASQITFGLTNPYEQAQTVTTVLRAQISYNPVLTLPPQGTDLIEWFLFDSKQGYCNYYASAEVLMLRSLGIPARLAVGYAQGEAVEAIQRPGETEVLEQVFNVYQKHMHAWPEVYFPGIGWVEFEPTTNQDPIIRPATAQPESLPVIPSEPAQEPEQAPPILPPGGLETPVEAVRLAPWQVLGIWTSVLLLVAVVFYVTNRKYALTTRVAEYVLAASGRRGDHGSTWLRNAALFVLADPFERAFHVINLDLRWLGHAPEPHFTPAERAKSLSEILPDGAGEAEVLLKEYHASQYSPAGGDLSAARLASRRLFLLGVRTLIERIG